MNQVSKRSVILFYKPYWAYIVFDIILLILTFVIILAWAPLSTQIPFQKYYPFAIVFSLLWLVISYFAHRYVRIKFMRIGVNALRLLVTAILVFGCMEGYIELVSWLGEKEYSIWMLLTVWLVMLGVSVVFMLFWHAYRYALDQEDEIERAPERGPQSVLFPPELSLTDEQKAEVRQHMATVASEEAVRFLEENLDIYSSNTYTVRTNDIYNIQRIKYFRYDTIINFMLLNNVRGINKMFGIVNDKLPDDGLFVCCFVRQSTLKRQVLMKYPPVINWLVYSSLYIYKRVIPKIFMTSRLYYDITEGKDRVLSKAEVMGRLCYCGFDIVNEQKINDVTYVIARRSFRPKTVVRRYYGIFVKLNRVGKNGKIFPVYKFRTMHPYSEYLQPYIYQRYGLREGGKLNHDIRVSHTGRFMRKYWIDELPMLLNLLRGDMKLVGVRPISKHYFSLYSEELQQKRIHHKPGLLPPFYADMPKTLSEIEASELKYLNRCEEKGTFSTDFIYFWKIFYTIIFRHARSH